MNAFEFEQPVEAGNGPRAGEVSRVPERELKHAVICETCRGGYLWRVRDRTVADVLGQAHAADTGHTVWVELRGVTRATGW